MWRQRVIECRSSGLTVKQWCEDNNVHYKLYCYWQRQVWDAEVKTMVSKEQLPEIPKVQFAEISLPAVKNEAGTADVVLHYGNWSVEIRNTASGEMVKQIIEQVSHHV
ncbi:MAG: hypothetical protein MJY74_08685 [Bacteroidaceae bacterium]|nr:hypothetical protein [Bacteroidaceae bacterium]